MHQERNTHTELMTMSTCQFQFVSVWYRRSHLDIAIVLRGSGDILFTSRGCDGSLIELFFKKNLLNLIVKLPRKFMGSQKMENRRLRKHMTKLRQQSMTLTNSAQKQVALREYRLIVSQI